MDHKRGRQLYFYCYTPYNDSFACAKRVRRADILEVVSDGLRVQLQLAVELSRLLEEQHREQKKDVAACKEKSHRTAGNTPEALPADQQSLRILCAGRNRQAGIPHSKSRRVF